MPSLQGHAYREMRLRGNLMLGRRGENRDLPMVSRNRSAGRYGEKHERDGGSLMREQIHLTTGIASAVEAGSAICRVAN